jgi:tetratricopeptide (TPR) repeat protein
MTENNDYSYLLDIINLVDNNENIEEDKININYEGDFALNDDIKNFNTNFIYTLLRDSKFNVSVSEKSKINNKTDMSIKEIFNKELEKTDINISFLSKNTFFIPKQGHWININSWEFGNIPKSWLESINDYLDEVWVISSYHKKSYIKSGIEEQKIKILNYGTDPLIFNPNVDKTDVKTSKKTKFLYKGDLDWKSGFDILLKSYIDEFTNDEDVSLIIIVDSKNINKNQANKVKNYLNDKDNPEIIIYDNLPDSNELAKIYKSIDFIISPYRTETLCVNIVDSMACGTPVIVNEQGASIDYCNNENSILIKSEQVSNYLKKIDEIETVDYPYWYEVKPNSLRVCLRKAYEMKDNDYKELSKNASRTILDNFTYIKISEKVKPYFKEILNKPIKRDLQNELNQHILMGLNNLTQGNYENSIIALDNALKISPNSESANFYMANLLFSKGDYKKALEYNLISLKINSKNEDYNNLMGIILYKLGDYKLSEKLFNRTIKIMPEHSGAIESLKAIQVVKTSNFINNDVDEETKKLIYSLIDNNENIGTPTLSVCIIAKNEEKNIEKAIKSVKNFSDEIILLDTGSTDNTLKIAEKEGVKIFNYPWDNSFANARNEALKYASMDWILMLDSDEFINIEPKDSIKPLLENLNTSKIYQIKIVNSLDNNNIEEKMEHYVPRLIPNNKNIKYIRDIHEYPVNIDNSMLESEILNSFFINHSGYLKKQVKEKDKLQRNRNILEKSLENNNDSLIDYFYLSENYKEDKNYNKVIELSKKVIELSKKYTEYDNLTKLSKINIIESYMINENYDEALKNAEIYKNDLTNRPDFWFLLGSIEFSLNNFDKCIENQMKALSLRDNDIYPSIDVGTITWKPLSLIAESYLKKNDTQKSILFFKKAIKENPQDISFYLKITDIYSKQNNINEMENILIKFITSIKPDDLSYLLENIYKKYIDNNLEDRLYKLLEYVRQTKSLEKNNHNLVNSLIKMYKEIQNKYPDMAAIKYSIACAYESIKDYNNAEILFNELSNEEVDSLHNLASIAHSKNDYSKAELLYKKVLDKDEFHIPSYIGLIKIYINIKDTDKTNEYIDKLKSIDPDNKEVSQLEFEIAKLNNNNKLASDIYASMLFNRDLLK